MAGYLGSIPVPQATQHRESFTATSGQTTFNTAGYTVGFLDVYLNGSHLSPADFTATNGSDVVLASGASADDVCDIISYTAFEVADQTFTGTTTMDVAAITGVLTTTAATVFNGGFAANDGSTITTADNTTQLTLISTDADASVGPVLDLYRNSASPADNDVIGRIVFNAENDADEKTELIRIIANLTDASNGSEDVLLQYYLMKDGGRINRLQFSPTETVFNDDSADIDFRVESNGNANMLFVDGGNDAVGIKTNTPATNGQFSVRGAIATASYGNVSGDFSDAATGSLKISHASGVVKLITDQTLSLVTGTSVVAMGIDATGAVTKPLQPAFQVKPASDQTNIAVGSEVSVVFGTEIFDQNADFASNTFTAPVTGKYHLDVHLYIESIDTAADYYQVRLVTSNRTYFQTLDFGGHSADPVYGSLSLSVLADMDASDTATVKILQVAGTQQTDVKDLSYFSGYLVA